VFFQARKQLFVRCVSGGLLNENNNINVAKLMPDQPETFPRQPPYAIAPNGARYFLLGNRETESGSLVFAVRPKNSKISVSGAIGLPKNPLKLCRRC
jgi:hypothetical protein